MMVVMIWLFIPSRAGTERELNLAQRSPRICAHTSQKQMLCGEEKKPHELFIVLRRYVSSSFTFPLSHQVECDKWFRPSKHAARGEMLTKKKKENSKKKPPKNISSRDPSREAKQLDPLFFSSLLTVRALFLWAAVCAPLSLFLYICCSWSPSAGNKSDLGTVSHCFYILAVTFNGMKIVAATWSAIQHVVAIARVMCAPPLCWGDEWIWRGRWKEWLCHSVVSRL